MIDEGKGCLYTAVSVWVMCKYDHTLRNAKCTKRQNGPSSLSCVYPNLNHSL